MTDLKTKREFPADSNVEKWLASEKQKWRSFFERLSSGYTEAYFEFVFFGGRDIVWIMRARLVREVRIFDSVMIENPVDFLNDSFRKRLDTGSHQFST